MSTSSGVRFWLPLDAKPGPASRISRARAANIVDAAMNFDGKSDVTLRRQTRRRFWSRVPLLAAAALVLPVTVVAGAVRFVAIRRATSAALVISTQAAAPVVVSPRAAPSRLEASAQSEPSDEPVVASPPVDPVESAPAVSGTTNPRPLGETGRARSAGAGHRPPVAEASPQDMLQRANDLRARHQWLAATQIYEETLRTFPGQAEAYSATVAAGMLHLDQLGDAKGALSLFSSAIRVRPRGPLAEEARWGVVQAHRALGDTRSELAALQEFVTQHPQSLLASRAQARLRALRGEAAIQ